MSQKINPTTIGLFIVAGLTLGVGGLLLFSSTRWFEESGEVIAYFDESLNGLNEGAPVKYRGVTIGAVKRVMVRFNQATNDYAMPVILELQEKLLRERLGDQAQDVFREGTLADRIEHGLRASLQTESLVTGVLYVDIRPNPNAPKPRFHQVRRLYPELPTEPTQIQKLFNNLASLDFKRVETNLNTLLTRLNASVEELRLADVSRGLTNLLIALDRLVTSPDLTNALASLRPTLDQYRTLGARLTDQVDPLAARLTNSLAGADRSLAEVRAAAENLRVLLAPDAPVPQNLDQSLQQLTGALQSLSALLDLLKQHPNALITGREPPPRKP